MPNRLPPATNGCVSSGPDDTDAVLDALYDRFVAAQATNIGFPAATDLDYAPLGRFLNFMVNNLGDPDVDGDYPTHTKAQEREVVTWTADLLRAPADDRWGYVTGGATEGTEHALWLARTRWPDAVVYHSHAAHPCIPAVVDRLGMRSIVVRAGASGEVDYDDLLRQVSVRRDRPAVVVANVGTAITEAVDDVRKIRAILDVVPMTRRWIHADAALTGIPLGFLAPGERPGFDFVDGADSIIVSGHKFVGAPMPCGVLIVRDSLRPDGRRPAIYTGSPNTTTSNSRPGLAALALWYTLRRSGPVLRDRAADCRTLAGYACQRLCDIGVAAWRHPHAFTVVFPTPARAVTDRWVLAGHGKDSHLICMPGVMQSHIDNFVATIAAGTPETDPAPGRTARTIVHQRGPADRVTVG
jgi:histidine decarboxylase